MEVFVMIMRKKTTIFIDAKESTSIAELKMIVQGILKADPSEQKLYYNDVELDDNKSLVDVGLNKYNSGAQSPGALGLAIGGEELQITPLSLPPEFPDAMKAQDASAEAACA